jgi:indolepyruvate ferredoxin oxidoreductase
VWLAESACDLAIASPSDRNTLEGSTIGRPLEAPPQLRTRGWMRRIAIRTGAAVRVRIRPFLEQVDVIRTRPPVAVGRDESSGVPLPRPVHAAAGRWRGHLAGYRGDSPGVAAAILCEAGRAMGYRVQATWEPAPIGRGRRAWAQVLFTRGGGDAAPLVAGIPYGEADLLLGLDPEETLRALGPDPLLRVASSDRTHAVVNLGAWEDQAPIDGLEGALRSAVGRACREGALVDDLISACRETFLSERLLDAMLLGVAFQSGLIPVSIDAMQQAVARVERRGYGRIGEAFSLGRRIAAGRRSRVGAPREAADVQRAIRRATRELAGARTRRRRIRDLIDETLAAMPGLLESRAGRRSAVEFASLLVAASVWGGLDHANRYAERIRRLYAVDRGDTGRELTRLAIGPVGEALLVRDLFYVSAMSLTPWHIARIRERLRVRTARGDRIERRFLYRIDTLVASRRGRLDLRTSDWLPIVLARLRRWIPWRWRGTPSERRLRDAVLDSVERAVVEVGAAEGDESAYRRWCETFRRMGGGGRRRLRGPAVIAESEERRPPRG